MAAGASGIDIRQMNVQLVFRAHLQGLAGAIVTSGTAVLRLYEFQGDGTLLSYDFDDNTFKSGALTTEDLSMTHRTGNNGATDTGIWTCTLNTLTGFTAGAVYIAKVIASDALPTESAREFQFGGAWDNSYDMAGQIRRLHGIGGGTKCIKDFDESSTEWVIYDEAGTTPMLKQTWVVAENVETISNVVYGS